MHNFCVSETGLFSVTSIIEVEILTPQNLSRLTNKCI
jgi:hypothetical protein